MKKLEQEHDPPYIEEIFPFGDEEYCLITKGGKIVLPKSLQTKAVKWYHVQLMHPGETRTELTMAQHYTWVGMRNTVKQVCQYCPSCQLTKSKTQHYGHLPPKEANVRPWETLCIDLIGPYTIGSKKNGDEVTLHCLTMIDPATGWFEIAEIPNKRADVIANVLEQKWLSRYPRPSEVIMDRGREFYAEVADTLYNEYGITRKYITTRNPQANSMIERAHQTVHNMIATLDIRGKKDLKGKTATSREKWDGVLSAVGFGMRATVHTTMKATPAQLVFGRDALLNVRFQADWEYIKQRKTKVIMQNNQKENAKRLPHTYRVGDQVLIEQYQHRKYGAPRYAGPYDIDRVNENGTVRLRQNTANGGAIYTTWNIRNIHPYKA
jgi:predicted outer membrane repeat protein